MNQQRIDEIKVLYNAAIKKPLSFRFITSEHCKFIERIYQIFLELLAEIEKLQKFCNEWCLSEDHFQEISAQIDCANGKIKELQEKQAAKEPRQEPTDGPFGKGFILSCPICKQSLNMTDKYCRACGQKLKWEE